MAKETYNLRVADDFTRTPGPRFRSEGKFSGEQFREEVLEPLFSRALAADAVICVDLDGGYGYATSFLEEAFGGLARHFEQQTVLSRFEFKSAEEPYLIDDIRRFIKEARG